MEFIDSHGHLYKEYYEDFDEVVARAIEREENAVVVSIGEGLYHHVRRMFAAVGNHVETLERISIGPLQLDMTLGRGGWRFLTDEEVASL